VEKKDTILTMLPHDEQPFFKKGWGVKAYAVVMYVYWKWKSKGTSFFGFISIPQKPKKQSEGSYFSKIIAPLKSSCSSDVFEE
jgi:hypothetical protein